jgi:hypothetical protein
MPAIAKRKKGSVASKHMVVVEPGPTPPLLKIEEKTLHPAESQKSVMT